MALSKGGLSQYVYCTRLLSSYRTQLALSKGGLSQYVHCTRLLSSYRTQFRVVTSLLTEHNTLTRHLYLTGLIDSPLCSRCGAEEET